MLKIKLARFGKRKQPHYRIIINEAREKRDGRYVDIIGHYAPTQQPKILQVDLEKFEAWKKKGAQPTDTVQALVTRFASGNPFPAKKARLSRKAKAKQAEAAAAKETEKAEAAAPTEATAVEATPEAAAPEATSAA